MGGWISAVRSRLFVWPSSCDHGVALIQSLALCELLDDFMWTFGRRNDLIACQTGSRMDRFVAGRLADVLLLLASTC